MTFRELDKLLRANGWIKDKKVMEALMLCIEKIIKKFPCLNIVGIFQKLH